jgi:aspartate racemase
VETIVPDEASRAFIQRTLKEELGRGIALPATKAAYLEIIDRLIADGAQGIVLACTELPLLLSAGDIAVPVFDSTRLHARAAVEFALA